MRSCKQGMARRLTSIISNRRRLRHGAEMAVYGGEIVQEILLEDLAGREADFYCDIFQVVEDISAHTHDFLEVAYILEGTLVHSAGGIPAPPGRGSILSLIMGFPMSTAVPWDRPRYSTVFSARLFWTTPCVPAGAWTTCCRATGST